MDIVSASKSNDKPTLIFSTFPAQPIGDWFAIKRLIFFPITQETFTIFAPMKTLCFILSLYVLLLGTVPCCSEDNCDDEKKTENPDNHSQDHKDSDRNTCSPFFTCGTCSGFIFIRTGLDFKKVPFIKNQLITVYKSQFTDGYFAKIWQPPKIS